MAEFNPLPGSISHKQLKALQAKAQKETNADDHPPEKSQEDGEFLKESLKKWAELSNEVIKNLSAGVKSLEKDKAPNEVMALGALEAHLKMALRAYKASKTD